jgi:hypothetical protein
MKAIHIPYKEQFDMLTNYIDVMGNGLINSMIVYGRAGLGKTKTIVQELKKRNINYIVFKGGIKGSFELSRILYKNRKDTVIIFDDIDSVFRTASQINLLMAALEDEPERTVTWSDSTKKRVKDRIPETFTFTSGIIFVSNKPRINAALKSRSKVIRFEMNNKEILDRINEVINMDVKETEYLPKVPKAFKLEVIKWAYREVKRFRKDRMDFRLFKYCIANYLMDKEQKVTDGRWKRWSLREINS